MPYPRWKWRWSEKKLAASARALRRAVGLNDAALAHALRVEMEINCWSFFDSSFTTHDTDQGGLVGLCVHTGGAAYK